MGYFRNTREPKDPVGAKLVVCKLASGFLIPPELVRKSRINAGGDGLLAGGPPEASRCASAGFRREWLSHSPQSFPLR